MLFAVFCFLFGFPLEQLLMRTILYLLHSLLKSNNSTEDSKMGYAIFFEIGFTLFDVLRLFMILISAKGTHARLG